MTLVDRISMIKQNLKAFLCYLQLPLSKVRHQLMTKRLARAEQLSKASSETET